MALLSLILDSAKRLWNCTCKRVGYVRELEEDLDTLKRKMVELNHLRMDMSLRVEYEERLQQRRRTHEVNGWLYAVQALGAEVEEILWNGDKEIQKKSLRVCPKNCWSINKLEKIVTEKIIAVNELTYKGRNLEVLSHRLPFAAVEEWPMGKNFGLELIFEKVQACIEDEQVKSIGLYGIGGVGKTTLLQKINNEFFGKGSHVVIWVVMSKPINIEKIQEEILRKLEVPYDTWNSSSMEKALIIFNMLKEKKFVILLDDMWAPLNLMEVGIPSLIDGTNSKVILTTRIEEVCDEMMVDRKIKVERLTPNEAFSLFSDIIGKTTMESHPEIARLAKIAVQECQGLPLALITLGRSMASLKTPRQWEEAIGMLQRSPTNFSGMEDVFQILKLSYDRLDNSTIKTCFLYCSLFPKDYKLWEEDLINLWIGEGILSEYDDIYEARSQGELIIRRLKNACFFKSDAEKNRCRMHDLLIDMGRWLLCDHGEEEQKIFVAEYVKLIEVHEIEGWREAQRISLWHSSFKELLVSPSFPNLRTFIMRNSGVKSLPIGFFQFMPIIRVLDLSDNENLEKLPLELCRLESLEYLNLARTGIKKVPIELKKLEKLRCLILDGMRELEEIPPSMISFLSNLRMFSMICYLALDVYGYEQCLLELECLHRLNEINVSLLTSSAVERFLSSQNLQKCVKYLMMDTCQGLKLLELPLSTLQRLKVVRFVFCNDLEDVKINKQNQEEQISMSRSYIPNSYFRNLVTVVIERCRFVNLTWLTYAQSLEDLFVIRCTNLEEIVAVDECGESEMEEQNLSLFSRLEKLFLGSLPKLKSIYKRPLLFPSLTKIHVINCPKLMRLPLNSDRATKTLKTIEGHSSWWEELEWESDLLKSTFAPYFQSSTSSFESELDKYVGTYSLRTSF